MCGEKQMYRDPHISVRPAEELYKDFLEQQELLYRKPMNFLQDYVR